MKAPTQPREQHNPHWDRLLAEAAQLRALNTRLADGMARSSRPLDAAAQALVLKQIGDNRHAADALEQQVAWYRHVAGLPVDTIPDGPAWTD